MGNSENGLTAIIVAIIGLIGVIAVAIINKLPNIPIEGETPKSDSIQTVAPVPNTPIKFMPHRPSRDFDKEESTLISNSEEVVDDLPLNSDTLCSLLNELNKQRKSNYQNIKGSQKETQEKETKTYQTTLTTEFSTLLTEFLQEQNGEKHYNLSIEIISTNKNLYTDVCNTIDNCFRIKINRNIYGKLKEGLIEFKDGGFIAVESKSKRTYIIFGQTKSN